MEKSKNLMTFAFMRKRRNPPTIEFDFRLRRRLIETMATATLPKTKCFWTYDEMLAELPETNLPIELWDGEIVGRNQRCTIRTLLRLPPGGKGSRSSLAAF
jgi:hypothetical protein